jgi:hypothetical protein
MRRPRISPVRREEETGCGVLGGLAKQGPSRIFLRLRRASFVMSETVSRRTYGVQAITTGVYWPPTTLDNIDVTWQYAAVSAAPGKKKKNGKAKQDEQSAGLWLDAALIAKLHGKQSSSLADTRTLSAESQRLLHYADVVLGTDKKERFIASKPTKDRTKL